MAVGYSGSAASDSLREVGKHHDSFIEIPVDQTKMRIQEGDKLVKYSASRERGPDHKITTVGSTTASPCPSVKRIPRNVMRILTTVGAPHCTIAGPRDFSSCRIA